MAIHGSLLTMPLAELLTWIQTSRRAGLVTVMRDGNEWELTFSGGRVSAYAGPEVRDNLGLVIVTSGMLTEEDLRPAYQLQRETDVSLQRAILEKGLLTRAQLRECLTELATESIYDLFIDLPGEFMFTEQKGATLLDLDDDADRLPLDLDINHLLMEGARRQDEWGAIRQRFPRDEIVVRIHHDKLPPFESLGVRERRVLASLSAGQSISDICFELRAPIPSVLRIIAAFEREGAVDVTDADGDAVAQKQQRVEQLSAQAQALIRDAQYDEAIALLEVAVRMRPDSESTREALKDALAEQVRDLYRALPPVKVPYVAAGDERLQRLRLRPEERFLLNRLSAQMDVGSLIMVSSMNERETLKTLCKLLHSGVIALR